MSEHLPECAQYHPSGDGFDLCICARLRACEARVREDEQRILIKHGAEQFVRGEVIGKAMGYSAGLSAARDAVAALPKYPGYDLDDYSAAEALAAIDALRGEA